MHSQLSAPVMMRETGHMNNAQWKKVTLVQSQSFAKHSSSLIIITRAEKRSRQLEMHRLVGRYPSEKKLNRGKLNGLNFRYEHLNRAQQQNGNNKTQFHYVFN